MQPDSCAIFSTDAEETPERYSIVWKVVGIDKVLFCAAGAGALTAVVNGIGVFGASVLGWTGVVFGAGNTAGASATSTAAAGEFSNAGDVDCV